MSTARRVLLLVVATALLPTTAAASVVRPVRDANLRTGPLGDAPYGQSVTGLGDVNGDGLADIGVLQGASEDPSVLVVLGSRARRTIAPRAPRDRGFLISDAPDEVPFMEEGAVEADGVGSAVAGAGDVNGDGLGDIVVGAAALGNSLRRGSGSAFVIFGKRDARPVRLDRLGRGGFRIDGPHALAGVGASVAGLGDVDGDGLDDVAVGGRGAAYVVFGASGSGLVDLRRPHARAEVLSRAVGAPELDEHAVAAAGDANGDGRADLVVTAGDTLSVVYGASRAADVDLVRLGPRGYEITGTGIDGPGPNPISGGGRRRGRPRRSGPRRRRRGVGRARSAESGGRGRPQRSRRADRQGSRPLRPERSLRGRSG